MNTQKYFSPVETVYNSGCNMDIRAKIAHSLAIAVLTSNAVVSLHKEDDHPSSSQNIARECCDIAEQLIDAFEQRGWVKPGLSAEDQVTYIAQMDYKAKVYRDKLFSGQGDHS